MQHVVANYCHSIFRVRIPEGSYLGHYKMLESISLVGCLNLHHVWIRSPSLRSLLLDDCPNLTTVELSCAQLFKLSATNCANLVIVSMDSPKPQQLNLSGCNQLNPEVMPVSFMNACAVQREQQPSAYQACRLFLCSQRTAAKEHVVYEDFEDDQCIPARHTGTSEKHA